MGESAQGHAAQDRGGESADGNQAQETSCHSPKVFKKNKQCWALVGFEHIPRLPITDIII